MPTQIKNIIFDLGGVLLDVDYHKPIEAFEKLGATGFEKVFTQASQARFMSQFERGEIAPAEFRKEVRRFLPEGVTDYQIDEAWNSILGTLPEDRIVLLKMLKNKGYRLFLLSNTNSIHIKAFQRYLQDSYGPSALERIFEKVYFSSRIGMRKPSQKVFDFVLRENNLQPEETFFIDDSEQHIEGAKKTGIHTHWLREPETVLDVFKDFPSLH
ncbi:MAG: HAD family phosphatase [Cryomorphaceae bacterium]|nr:MAG: HAD family phosphatase [Cryomorphaceae bacterium]